MIYSMTGFADSHRALKEVEITLEIKAVNHRYLNITLKLPDELHFLEAKINGLISGEVTRGKVECRITTRARYKNEAITLNPHLSAGLIALNKKLVREAGINPLSVADLLQFPGMLSRDTHDPEALAPQILRQVEKTLTDFNESRRREGENLKKHLAERLAKINVIVAEILTTYRENIADYTRRLGEKLEQLLAEKIEPERLNQELALYVGRIDIDEELTRLKSHLREAERILTSKKDEPVGKRLDFMMQEFNREVNTMASKSGDSKLTQATIELKVLIEQMREQIQNIE